MTDSEHADGCYIKKAMHFTKTDNMIPGSQASKSEAIRYQLRSRPFDCRIIISAETECTPVLTVQNRKDTKHEADQRR